MQLTCLLCLVDMHVMTDNIKTNIQTVTMYQINHFTLLWEVTTASRYTCDIAHIQSHLILPIHICSIFHQILYNIYFSCFRCKMKCAFFKLKQDFRIIKYFITFKWVRIWTTNSPYLRGWITYRYCTIYIVWQWHVICTVLVLVLVVEIF